MRTRSLAFILIALLFFSCAGGPAIQDAEPEWLSQPPQDSDTQYAFRGTGDGDTQTFARSAATDDLIDNILDAMNLGPRSSWNSEGKSAFDKVRQEIAQAVRNPEAEPPEGMVVARKEAWHNDRGSVSYAVDILWDKEAFDELVLYLADLTGVAGPEFRAFEERAREAEEAGNFYEAALLWAAAAGVAEKEGNEAALRLALQGITEALDSITYRTVSIPLSAFEGERPADPVVFLATAGDKPVGNAEFVITYPRMDRDGITPGRSEARINSDAEGYVRFLPPEITIVGIQEISIAPSARPFLEYLENPEAETVRDFVRELEIPAAFAEFEAVTRLRTIPMAILILETDVAGMPFPTVATAQGLEADLLADGFDVEIMALDPREMESRSDSALLRDLKADSALTGPYERVLHAKVSLVSFTQDGDTYTVKVTGRLSMSDIQRQVTLFETAELTVSSSTASSQQAITATFRKLGRSFAEQLIALAP